jgi:hypothetical protein
MISLNNIKLNKNDCVLIKLNNDTQLKITCIDENEFIISYDGSKTKSVSGVDSLYRFLQNIRKNIVSINIKRSKKKTEYKNIMEKQFNKQ